MARHLAGFNGILQVDGYAGYTSMIKAQAKAGHNDQIKLAGCWAHLRRKFYDLHVSGISQTATNTVVAMAELWRIEDEARGKSADIRAAFRQDQSAAIVARLFGMWEKELGKVSGKSKTAEAIRYALTRREALQRFLTDGRIEIDSNIVERAIRPQTITRKNSLFAGSEGGGRTWATLATLLQTCKMNSVDPLNWLSQTLSRIAQGWPVTEIEDLIAWNYKANDIG
ncbi:transposase [Paenochrobactrum gallinarii]|uniref:Transposase n=1 Tax=Paenochrobactrum gallinarii TaxID=643673 RepID=A0A841M7H7_9HYPH|nr:transposase [Paenochrobactrum gallinarii]